MENNVDVADVFSAVEAHNETVPGLNVKPAPVHQTQTPSPAPAEPTQTQTAVADDTPEDEQVYDTQDYSRQPVPAYQEADTTTAPSQNTEVKTQTETQTSETNTQTETVTETAPEIDWRSSLPPAPQPYNGPVPEVDADGVITNMTPQQYEQYLRQSIAADGDIKSYNAFVQSRALDAAEQILPEMKTNPTIRTLVQNMQVASVINGNQIDAYDAAKQVREALGLAPERLAQARAEGAQSQKVSIEVQKRAAVELGGNQTPEPVNRMDHLDKRLRMGDENAMAEMLDIWMSEGKI